MKFNGEEFRKIPDYEGYLVSKGGQILSLCKDSCGRLMKQNLRKDGYLHIMFTRNGLKENEKPHRLVLLAWRGPPSAEQVCRHLDGNRANNSLENLCWGTRSENCQDMVLHGTDSRGEKSVNAKLTQKQVIEIRQRHKLGGISQKDLAPQYNISRQHLCNILHRRHWAHLSEVVINAMP